MGYVKDYFRPIKTMRLCDMLQSNQYTWSWSGEEGTFIIPSYEPDEQYLGGSRDKFWHWKEYLLDGRERISFWGSTSTSSNARKGGCCSYTSKHYPGDGTAQMTTFHSSCDGNWHCAYTMSMFQKAPHWTNTYIDGQMKVSCTDGVSKPTRRLSVSPSPVSRGDHPSNYRVRRLSTMVSNNSSTITMGGTVMMSQSNIETRTSSSDARVKTNVKKVDPNHILEDLMRLEVKHYDYTTNFLKSTQRLEGGNIGFIAQEVEKIVPNAVHTIAKRTLTHFDEEAKEHVILETLKNFKTLNKDYMMVMSVASIQALHHKLESMEAQQAAFWNNVKTTQKLSREVRELSREVRELRDEVKKLMFSVGPFLELISE